MRHTIGFSRLENNPEPIQYAIITNKLLKYVVPSWNGRTLQSYSVHDEHNPLQLKLFASFNEAVEYAMSLSQENDVDCIVAQWFADIDMHWFFIWSVYKGSVKNPLGTKPIS